MILDIICSCSDGRLCLVNSSSGKVKVRVDEVFGSKSTLGSFVSLDEEDKLLAVGNDDGDVKVVLRVCGTVFSVFIIIDY